MLIYGTRPESYINIVNVKRRNTAKTLKDIEMVNALLILNWMQIMKTGSQLCFGFLWMQIKTIFKKKGRSKWATLKNAGAKHQLRLIYSVLHLKHLWLTSVPMWLTSVLMWLTSVPMWLTPVPMWLTSVPMWLTPVPMWLTSVPMWLTLYPAIFTISQSSNSARGFLMAMWSVPTVEYTGWFSNVLVNSRTTAISADTNHIDLNYLQRGVKLRSLKSPKAFRASSDSCV